MTQYLLSMFHPDGPVPEPDVLAKVMADVGAVREEMQRAGIWVFAGGLAPSTTATVLRPQGEGPALITDGPYLESKEHLGGITVIDVPDLDAALPWAAKLAAATALAMEVRPFRG
jgi:hypothetical protein